MRRPNPTLRADDALAAWDAAKPSATSASLTLKCTLMTPMFGGGVTPGVVDHDLPIRPGAVRGQLRFWWRLLHRASHDPQATFSSEAALWGAISGTGPRASRVALRVRGGPVGSEEMVGAKDRDFPTYAFILERDDNPALLKSGYEFMVTLRFTPRVTDAQRDQVIEALRWWASFGGVGARTRRGLGAVKASSNDIELKPVTREDVESRGGRMVLGAPREAAIEAWKDAVEALKSFRQGENVARNRGNGKRPGRSRWPEPDVIRRLTGNHAPGHEPEHAVDGFFPRAAFGLPIVFQFKNRNEGDPKGPKGKGLTLAPTDRDRMASPLILRPCFDGKRYRPLALLLPGWDERVSVSVGLDSQHAGPAWPEAPEEREGPANSIGPMQGRSTDVLTAFMRYFEHHWHKKHDGGRGQGRGGR